MISPLRTVVREMSPQDPTSCPVILKRTLAHGTMTTLPAFCGNGVTGNGKALLPIMVKTPLYSARGIDIFQEAQSQTNVPSIHPSIHSVIKLNT